MKEICWRLFEFSKLYLHKNDIKKTFGQSHSFLSNITVYFDYSFLGIFLIESFELFFKNCKIYS